MVSSLESALSLLVQCSVVGDAYNMASESPTDKPIMTTTTTTAVWADALTSYCPPVQSKPDEMDNETWLNQTITKSKVELLKKISKSLPSDMNIMEQRMRVDQFQQDDLVAPNNRLLVFTPLEKEGRLAIWNALMSLKDQKREQTQREEKQRDLDAQTRLGFDTLLREHTKKCTQEIELLRRLCQIESDEKDQLMSELSVWKAQSEERFAKHEKCIKELTRELQRVKRESERRKDENDGKIDRAVEDKVRELKKDMKEQIKQLENENTALKAELRGVRDKLDEAKDELDDLKQELADEKKERKRVEQRLVKCEADVARLTRMMMPIHFCILLDESRTKICQILNKNLEDVMREKPGNLLRFLKAKNKQGPLSEPTLAYLLDNPIRELGNNTVHDVPPDDIYRSMKTPANWHKTKDQGHMEQLFEFCFRESFANYKPGPLPGSS